MLEWDTIAQDVVQLIGIPGVVAPVGTPANDLILGISNANSTIAVIKPAGTPSSERLLHQTATCLYHRRLCPKCNAFQGYPSCGRSHFREQTEGVDANLAFQVGSVHKHRPSLIPAMVAFLSCDGFCRAEVRCNTKKCLYTSIACQLWGYIA